MDTKDFEKALRRYDPDMFLRRGPHPKIERRWKNPEFRGNAKARESLDERMKVPFWTAWRRDPYSGGVFAIRTFVDDGGRPRRPSERDLQWLAQNDPTPMFRGNRRPTPAMIDQWMLENLDNPEAEAGEKLEAEHADYMGREVRDRAKYAVERDGIVGPVRGASRPNSHRNVKDV